MEKLQKKIVTESTKKKFGKLYEYVTNCMTHNNT